MNEVFDEKVPYDKRPLSIQTQIERLKGRGLIIDDEKLAVDYLSNISYYRLRAYTYPFQDNTHLENDHSSSVPTFILKISLIYIVSTDVCVLLYSML